MKFQWFIGIDISKKTFDAAIHCPSDARKSVHCKFDNADNGFCNFTEWLAGHGVDLDEAFACMENTGIYGMQLAAFLDGRIACCILNALQIKRSMGIVRGKNDKADSIMIARFCYLYRDEIKPTKLPSKALQTMRVLYAERERIIKALKIEKTIASELGIALSANAQQRMDVRMRQFENDLKAIDRELLEVVNENPDIKKNYELATSVVGVGLVNALLMIIHSYNFERITDSRPFACYCGIAPFDHVSGTSVKGKTRVSHLGNKQIKAQLTNAARSAVINDPEIRRYYNRKQSEGKHHGVIMNAIKFKIVTRVYATVKRGTPFVKLRQAG
jgi:transposase